MQMNASRIPKSYEKAEYIFIKTGKIDRMDNEVMRNVLGLILDISLKARVLKEWQTSHAARKAEFSGRQIIILELAKFFAPLTEKELGKIFGMPTSSINDLVEKLVTAGLVEKERKKEGDSREKPITLTDKGKKQLEEIKLADSTRYEYLLTKFQANELKGFIGYLEKVNESVESAVKSIVFQQY
jgi:DNA-binding MarR family transcriptional regulator